MRQARDDAAELTAVALELVESAIGEETPEACDRAHCIAQTYLQLARAAVERFEEAARGA